MKTGVLRSYLHGCDPPYPEEEQILNNITKDFPPTLMYVALEDDLIPPEGQKKALEDKLGEFGIECRVLMVQAPHGFIDLPARYFPDRAQGWWDETVQPALEWAIQKMNA
jgi:acetyl esterase/lipase